MVSSLGIRQFKSYDQWMNRFDKYHFTQWLTIKTIAFRRPEKYLHMYIYSPINIATTPQKSYNSINKDKRLKLIK